MNSVVIAIGSNIDPRTNTQRAVQILEQKYKIIQTSAFVETKPLVFIEQPNFLNGAVLMETGQSREELKEALKQIETALGRSYSANKCGPRTIDLDIVVWNEDIIDKDFYARDFLKNSVLELLPNLRY